MSVFGLLFGLLVLSALALGGTVFCRGGKTERDGPEAAMWRMIVTSLRHQKEDWDFGLFGHVLYNRKADFSVWISNGVYGLSAGIGEKRNPRHGGALPHEIPNEKWRDRLWRAAEPYIEEQRAKAACAYFDQVAQRFERTVN